MTILLKSGGGRSKATPQRRPVINHQVDDRQDGLLEDEFTEADFQEF